MNIRCNLCVVDTCGANGHNVNMESELKTSSNERKTRSDKKTIDLSDLDTIHRLAAYGHTVKEIADIMGMSRSTFYARIAENPEIANTIQKGKSIGKNSLIERAHEMAMAGDREMLKYLLSRIHGLSEVQILEHRETIDIDKMTDEEIENEIKALDSM